MLDICLAGKNQIAVDALSFLLNDLNFKKNSIFICPNKNDPGFDTWQPSLRLYAEKQNIDIVSLKEIFDIQNLIFISLEFDRIIKPHKFKSDKLFNFHFSLLPAYKGVYTSIFPIMKGEKRSGVTLHKMDPGIDTGDIIAQESFEIDINDTARDLYFKYLRFGFNVFKRNIKDLINNKYTANPQPYLDSSYYSRDDLDFSNIPINLNKTSYQIHNQIRSLIFEEYQLPNLGNKKIYKSQITSEKIEKNYYQEKENIILLSGIDGYKIILSIK